VEDIVALGPYPVCLVVYLVALELYQVVSVTYLAVMEIYPAAWAAHLPALGVYQNQAFPLPRVPMVFLRPVDMAVYHVFLYSLLLASIMFSVLATLVGHVPKKSGAAIPLFLTDIA
jgi:hypothetical protein